MAAGISGESLLRRFSPFRACLTPDFYQRAVAPEGSAALMRNPLPQTLDSLPFTLRTTRPSRGCAVIHISGGNTSTSPYPFTVLSARMCTELRALLETIAKTDASISTIALVGEGRGFLVAPQLSFLSKLCVGQAQLALSEDADDAPMAGDDQQPSLAERTRDYTDAFHAFIGLYASLNAASREEYLSSVDRLRARLLFAPAGVEQYPDGYATYVHTYCDRLVAKAPWHFSSQLIVVGVNGMAFGLGTHIARSADVAFGNQHTAWDCPPETRALFVENPSLEFEKQTESTRFATLFPETFLSEIHRSVVRRRLCGQLRQMAPPNPQVVGPDPPGDISFLSAQELRTVGEIVDDSIPPNGFVSGVISLATRIAALGQPRVHKLKRYLRGIV
ncbi:Enoyl-CoA hydratase / carnithine racemase [Perkinsela sp. CCAP 1560/4]|nr:Enoyl-CoA hydratase / carnithine racemase [Perkinsela sp. CCAP 1560/4]|eukprot:KNH06247.1 Enoyl-CoA hydratase / carnithine racemase [Perkinsela sp. CCAP 1560/4]